MKNSILLLAFVFLLNSCAKDDTTSPSGGGSSAPSLPEEFQDFANIFDGEGVGAAINLTEDILLLFNKSGTRYAWFEEQEVKNVLSVNGSDTHFQDCTINDIGSGMHWTNTRVYLFNEDGERYTYFDFDPSDIEGGSSNFNIFTFSTGYHETHQWGPDNTSPFNEIGCMWPYTSPGSGCFDAYEETAKAWMVNRYGDEIVYYDGYFGAEMDLEDWTAENNCGGQDGLVPFDRIGAVCRYVKANAIQEIFFNEEGTKFCFHSVSEGIFSEIYDLY